MKTSKYIEFESISDLAQKLEKLIAHREKTLLQSRNWLIANKINYQVMPNGDLGIDLKDLNSPEHQQALENFKKIGDRTKEFYKSLGVVFLDTFENYRDLTAILPEN